ncbi:hypothetical protein GH714_032894 [Hevea brasiliensis]|uniref:Uncharacterized protein n=1 Tax=Hevea brasiliensis TaxID=3981 RepID=A0A6A6LM79_HEVBR|nr:hypothetical protein GH714_032894 [Hevea brasiliensis]
MVVPSISAVEVLANSPPLIMGKHLGYNHTTLATAPCGDHWRNLRRICALEILSTNRLYKFVGIRRDEIKIFLEKIYRISSQDFAKVELRPMLSELTFNIITRMAPGKRYGSGEEATKTDEASQFRKMMKEIFMSLAEIYERCNMVNMEPSNYQEASKFPEWRQAMENEIVCKAVATPLDPNVKLSKENGDSILDATSYRSFIGSLLYLTTTRPDLMFTTSLLSKFMNSPSNSHFMVAKRVLKYLEGTSDYGVLYLKNENDILFGGTESSAFASEWAMSNLLNNSQVLEKAKKELDFEIGQESLMDESDVSKLPHLQSIISETLRLHPAGKFKPERFEGAQGEPYNSKFLPFGLGRGACPGMGLANRVLGFTLGRMIQRFEWMKVDDRATDMTEGIGVTKPNAKPLEAMCKARDIMKVSSSL